MTQDDTTLPSTLNALWHEVFDAEARLGRLEQQVATIQAQRKDEADAASGAQDTRRFQVSTLIAVVSTVAFVLSLLAELGVRP